MSEKFEHFMLKEIFEQPEAVKRTIGTRLENDKIKMDELNFTKEYLESLNKIYVIGCGTAMHAGLYAKRMIETLCKIPVEVDIASEFTYREPLIDEKNLAIFITQSGETADTRAALKLAKEKGAKTLAMPNVKESSITKEADYAVCTEAGPEIAIASTKAYTAQVVMLAMITIHIAEILQRVPESEIQKLKKDLIELPERIEGTLKSLNEVKEVANKIYEEKNILFLGRGIDYAVCREAALKLKETTYIHSEGFALGELKHGPIAAVDDGMVIITVMTDENLKEKSLSNIEEAVEKHNAKIVLITNQNMDNQSFEAIINIPKTNKLLSPVLSIIPLQMLAYCVAVAKGLNVDKPRNLVKAVKVE